MADDEPLRICHLRMHSTYEEMKGHPKDELMLWLCIVCAVLLFLSMTEMAHTHDHTSECIQIHVCKCFMRIDCCWAAVLMVAH